MRIFVVALLLLVGCGATTDPEGTREIASAVSEPLAATLSLTSTWSTGYCANVSVANTGATKTSTWTVAINPNQSAITNSWSANFAVSSGRLTITPLSWNAAIPAGAAISFGFCAKDTGANFRPVVLSADATAEGNCTAGIWCTPTNVCRTGQTSCATGVTTCVDTGANVVNGTACGTNRVCDNGLCVSCTSGASCVPTDACHLGAVSCATGSSRCVDTGANVVNGTACGANLICQAGQCI